MKKIALTFWLAFAAPAFAANVDIPALPAASSVAGTDLFECSQSGVSDKCTAAQFATYLASLTQTLTNKTMTSPVINTPTGLVKGDVGLSAVSNALQLVTANNLSDLTDAAAARNNLGTSPPMFPDFSDAGIYLTNYSPASAIAAGSMFLNVLYMIPVWVPVTRTYTTYALAVTTGTATSVIRLGLYNSNSSLQPTTKIDEIGTPLDGTTNALKTGAFGVNATLKPGLYFIAAVVNVTTPVVRQSVPSSSGTFGSLLTATGVSANAGKSRSFTYAALPVDETSNAGLYTVIANGGTSLPFVGIR